MNKNELVTQVVASTGQSVKAVNEVVDAVFEAIMDAVAEGDTATFVGFGAFSPVTRAARTGRNPQTGEAIEISEKVAPKFAPGRLFKAKVNKG